MASKIAKLPPVKPITAVSYSRLQGYEWCPQTLRYKVSMGLKEPGSEAMERGNDSHKIFERVIKAPGKALAKLPKEYAHMAPELREIRKHGVGIEAEAQFAYDHDWKTVPYFDARVWWRMKIDLRYIREEDGGFVVRLLDYKTGKVKPEEHTEQLQLYALVELLRTVNDDTAVVVPAPKKGAKKIVKVPPVFPDRIETAVWYADHELEPRVLTVYESPDEKTLAQLKKFWAAKANRLTSDTQLAPTPSAFKCGRCHFSKWNHDGPCQAAAKAKTS